REFPPSGEGSHPALGDLARAVAIVLSTSDATERHRAVGAVAVIAVGMPELFVPEASIGWHTCGSGRRYRNDDPDSTCVPGGPLADARAEVARLSDDERATIA